MRFRPIVMTSVAFLLGVWPLMRAQGAGAASQQSIGTGVFGGTVFATTLGLIMVPTFFVLVSYVFGAHKKHPKGTHGAATATATAVATATAASSTEASVTHPAPAMLDTAKAAPEQSEQANNKGTSEDKGEK